jgi:hypothetical protein
MVLFSFITYELRFYRAKGSMAADGGVDCQVPNVGVKL